MWLLLLIPIVLTFAINFQATRNPVASFILLMITAIIYGVTFAFIAVIIFTILTAWDAQRMKNIYLQFGEEVSTNGLAVMGALQLYLDFVNLFLQFLTIFGSNDNNN